VGNEVALDSCQPFGAYNEFARQIVYIFAPLDTPTSVLLQSCKYLTFEALAAARIKTVIWDMRTCSLIDTNPPEENAAFIFKESYLNQFSSRKVNYKGFSSVLLPVTF
jgi:hypothetical protein